MFDLPPHNNLFGKLQYGINNFIIFTTNNLDIIVVFDHKIGMEKGAKSI